jgi:Peptidase C39 family
MRPRWTAVLLLGAAVAANWPGSTAAFEGPPRADFRDCGTTALYHLFHLAGRTTDLDQLRSAIGPVGADGHSFRQLRDAAGRFGLAVDAVALPKRRSAIRGPVLLFAKLGREGHFFVVRPVGHTGRLVQVLDGEHPPAVIDAERLFNSPAWTGLALVPRRSNHLALAAAGLALACTAAFAVRLWTRAHGNPPIDAQRRATDSSGSGDRASTDRVP